MLESGVYVKTSWLAFYQIGPSKFKLESLSKLYLILLVVYPKDLLSWLSSIQYTLMTSVIVFLMELLPHLQMTALSYRATNRSDLYKFFYPFFFTKSKQNQHNCNWRTNFLCSQGNFIPPRPNKEIFCRVYLYIGPRLFNKFPFKIKHSSSCINLNSILCDLKLKIRLKN